MKLVLTEGDTANWVILLEDPESGAPIDLTGATVALYMWTIPEQGIVIDGAACSHDDDGGTVTYDVQLDDVDEPGEYQAQLKVTLANSKTRRYPDPQVDERWDIEIIHAVEGTDTNAS